MSVVDNVLRATAFHALASCYPDLHRQLGGHPEHEILLKASEELTQLRAEQDLLLAVGRLAHKHRAADPELSAAIDAYDAQKLAVAKEQRNE